MVQNGTNGTWAISVGAPRHGPCSCGRSASMPVRVHLADDHTMFREGLEAIFSSRGSIEVVGRSSTGGEDTIALIEENKPDVVITQIDTTLNTAKEVLSRIRSASPDSKIVVLTMSDNLRYLQALSKFGIDAYIHKSSSSEELLATIERQQPPAGREERGGLHAP